MRHAALLLMVCLVATRATDAQHADVECIRFLQSDQRWILTAGMAASPTLASIATELCKTDIIALVHVDHIKRSPIRGDCGLLSATPKSRYVRIRLNGRSLSLVDLIAVLSHELEHAVEIGHATWVRRPEHVSTLQRVLVPLANHSVAAERAEARTRGELQRSGVRR
jgi:hypothetical protein